MILGWERCVQYRPRRYRRFPFNLPYVKPFAACIAASLLSIVIWSYMKQVQFAVNNDRIYFSRSGSQIEESSELRRRFNLINSHVDRTSTDSKIDTANGLSEQTYNKSMSPKALTDSNMTFEVKLNCTGTNMTLELYSVIPSHFLPKYKNPCWYEPLVKADVYEGNAFKEYTYFDKLVKEWTKRLGEQRDPKRLRCLPYYFLAGQPKCGSTDLYEKITSHPDVVTTPRKEPHWWSKTRFGEHMPWTGIPFQDYLGLFDKAALSIEHDEETNSSKDESYQQVITGDASASTLWFNDHWWELEENCGHTEPRYILADYIRHLLPDSKFIVILRNPTERLYSDFLDLGKPPKSPDIFHKEVVLAIDSLQKCLNVSTMRSCIYNRTVADYSRAHLRRGIYHVFLQEWLMVFPRQQFLILRLEDYSRDRLDTLKNVFKFLGLRPLTSEEEQRIFYKSNVANARRKEHRELGDMREDTRLLLDNFYRPYNQELSVLLHDHKYLWS